MEMDVEQKPSFKDTPKDGKWYQIPIANTELEQYIAWENNQWKWMVLKGKTVIDSGRIDNGVELYGVDQ